MHKTVLSTNSLINKGFRFAVIAAYSHKNFEQGEIVSKHKTYDAANKSAKNNDFLAIRDL